MLKPIKFLQFLAGDAIDDLIANCTQKVFADDSSDSAYTGCF